MRRRNSLLFSALFAACNAVALEPSSTDRFFSAGFSAWESVQFKGETHYFPGESGGEKCLRAESDRSASGLMRKERVDLEKTPYLNWSWRVERFPESLNERTRQGDDFAARIYVIVDGGLFFWKSRAVNYVWSRHEPVGENWSNPFAGDNSRMISIASGKTQPTLWRSEKRNIQEDFQILFGASMDHIDGVAIMTDADNSHSRSVACYRDIYFSAE